MGRIYRVVPDGQPLRKLPRLDQMHGEQLAAVMNSHNGTTRDPVQQQIQWNNDRRAIPALKTIALDSLRPEVRIQA